MPNATQPQPMEATAPDHEADLPDTAETTEPDTGQPYQSQPDDGTVDDGKTSDETQSEDAEAEDQSDEDDGLPNDANTPEDGDGLIDVEFEGKPFKVPAQLKDALMRDRDYRHKTQEIEQERRELSAMRQVAEQVGTITQEELSVHANLQSINQHIGQFADVDWNAWEAQDPDGAQRGFRDYQLLKEQQGQMAHALQATDQMRTAAMQQELGMRINATRDFAAKTIPGWNTELDTKIGEFAKKELGVDEAWMAQNLTPQAYKAFYLAHVGAQSLERAQAKPRAARGAQHKPLSKVKSRTGSSGRKAIEDMSFAEYEAFRKKQAGSR